MRVEAGTRLNKDESTVRGASRDHADKPLAERLALARLRETLFPELDRSVAVPRIGRYEVLRRGDGAADPRIVTVYGIGRHAAEHGEPLYVVMELVRGPNLASWLRGNRPPWTAIVDVFVEAGRGLAAAHARGILHRDFKPANVLLTPDRHAKIADFGLARIGGPRTAEPSRRDTVPGAEALTDPDTILGTPAYMAPELLGDRPADALADQYAYCVSLWEGLRGQRPFPPAQTWTQFDELRQRPPEVPRDTAIPVGIFDVLRRGLAHAPDERWPSMDALLSALQPRRRPAARWIGMVGGAALVLGALATVPGPPSRSTAAAWEGEDRTPLAPGAQTLAKIQRIETMQRAGRYADALAVLDEARAPDPTDAAALDVARGHSLRMLARFDHAQATLEAAYFAAEDAGASSVAGLAAVERQR